jgi:hypothetical protein
MLLTPAILHSTARGASTASYVTFGGRYHAEQEELEELPFGEGDTAYGLAYEYHEQHAAWQLGATYCSDLTGDTSVDYAITPELNLITKDRFWRGGAGILYSYLDREDDQEWVGPYWQFLFGIDLPIMGGSLQARTYYDFEDIDELDEFDLGKLDYGAWISFSF